MINKLSSLLLVWNSLVNWWEWPEGCYTLTRIRSIGLTGYYSKRGLNKVNVVAQWRVCVTNSCEKTSGLLFSASSHPEIPQSERWGFSSSRLLMFSCAKRREKASENILLYFGSNQRVWKRPAAWNVLRICSRLLTDESKLFIVSQSYYNSKGGGVLLHWLNILHLQH